MGTPKRDADRFLDTNVLLCLTTPSRALHGHAVRVVDGALSSGVRLCISGQVLRELLVVSTRPVEANGLGLARAAALANADVFRGRLEVLPESDRVCDRLRWLLENVSCTGNQIHDANIVATMLVAGVETLVTANPSHFARYERYIAVIPLSDP